VTNPDEARLIKAIATRFNIELNSIESAVKFEVRGSVSNNLIAKSRAVGT
ncbi:MAG: hypothetical protein H0X31_22935, partial [Nostocaceae cyanobacterium]|nr:hypothetical protein [Nostocaceae cyanobacterium]